MHLSEYTIDLGIGIVVQVVMLIFEECLCEDCDFCHSNTNCVIMQALSQAKNLVLSAHEQEVCYASTFIFNPPYIIPLFHMQKDCPSLDIRK